MADASNVLISNPMLSSVVPCTVTAENTVHELTNTDLVMKFHYIRAVYLFRAEAVAAQGGIPQLKEALFPLLTLYCPVAGRIRRSEDRRPLIKCNDSGVRIVEAQAGKTMEEWMEMINGHDQLVYDHVLGPDLGYTPLVFIQFTVFKCGGLSVGLSWAHILGDAFSASAFINMWGQVLTGNIPAQLSLSPSSRKKFQFPSSLPEKPFSIKMANPMGHDHWLASNGHSKMSTLSLHFPPKQLDQCISKINSSIVKNPFQALTIVIWKSLAKIRGEESEPRVVTICTTDSQTTKGNGVLGNNQLVYTVQADISVAKANALDLAKLVEEKRVEENGLIEELVERGNGNSDFVLYGANLTFLNLEEANVYGFEMKGQKPVVVNYMMDGVGDQGLVLVLPGPGSRGGGTIVNMSLPDDQVGDLKNELMWEWGLISNYN